MIKILVISGIVAFNVFVMLLVYGANHHKKNQNKNPQKNK